MTEQRCVHRPSHPVFEWDTHDWRMVGSALVQISVQGLILLRRLFLAVRCLGSVAQPTADTPFHSLDPPLPLTMGPFFCTEPGFDRMQVQTQFCYWKKKVGSAVMAFSLQMRCFKNNFGLTCLAPAQCGMHLPAKHQAVKRFSRSVLPLPALSVHI